MWPPQKHSHTTSHGTYILTLLTYLEKLGYLEFVLGKNDIRRAVISNVVAGFWVIGGVNTTPHTSCLQ